MARTDNLDHFLTDVADAIRTKAGTSGEIQASAFDTAIANIPSGGSSDIYRATSFAGLPQSANEGDIGIVYKNETVNPTASTEFSVVSVPTSYTFSTAITGTNSLQFRATGANYPRVTVSLRASGSSTVQVQLTSSSATRTTYTYTTSDALTYTLSSSSPTPTIIDLGTAITMYSTTFNENASKLVLIPIKEFSSYTYSNNSWGYTDIGANATTSDICVPTKAYTNNGMVIGAYDKSIVRDNYLKIGNTEPTDITGIWLKTSNAQTFNKNTKYTITNTNIMPFTKTNNAKPTYSFSSPVQAQNKIYWYRCETIYDTAYIYVYDLLTQENTQIATISSVKYASGSLAICNGYLYIVYQNQNATTNYCKRIDLSNYAIENCTFPNDLTSSSFYLFANSDNTKLYLNDRTTNNCYSSTDGSSWTKLTNTINVVEGYYWLDSTTLITLYAYYVYIYDVQNDIATLLFDGSANEVKINNAYFVQNINNHLLAFTDSTNVVYELTVSNNYTSAEANIYSQYSLGTNTFDTFVYNNVLYILSGSDYIFTANESDIEPMGIEVASELVLQVDTAGGTEVEIMTNQFAYISNALKVNNTNNLIQQIYVPNSDKSAWVLYKNYAPSES